MAILQFENGNTCINFDEITHHLSDLNVQLKHWEINPSLREKLTQTTLTKEQQDQVLKDLNHYFEILKQNFGYQDRDLVVLYPELPKLDTLLAKFQSCHTHADDEVRYIIDGEGVFGFVCPDGSQMELTMQSEEYINIPANTEHWFHLTTEKRIKLVRYFTSTQGWIPEYTDTAIRFLT